jgi:hypothetical protein
MALRRRRCRASAPPGGHTDLAHRLCFPGLGLMGAPPPGVFVAPGGALTSLGRRPTDALAIHVSCLFPGLIKPTLRSGEPGVCGVQLLEGRI